MSQTTQNPEYKRPILFGIGSRVFTQNGTLATVRYPYVGSLGVHSETAEIIIKALDIQCSGVQNLTLWKSGLEILTHVFQVSRSDKRHAEVIKVLVAAHGILSVAPSGGHIAVTFIFDDVPPQGVEDATLKLYGLSKRLFRPNRLNLSGVFNVLPTVTWVGDQPMDKTEVGEAIREAAFGGKPFAPDRVDKFPLFLHRITADEMGIRISDAHKVRLGAYLGEGTVVMPGATFVNYNAGTEGKAMIEGRVSSSAFIGDGTDIGDGATMLGTLSGGNSVPISIGRNCLLGLNCAVGISLGDAVIVAAGTELMAGSLVRVNVPGHPLSDARATIKASELAGISGVTFRRNDRDGALEVVRIARNEELEKKSILNAQLHGKS